MPFGDAISVVNTLAGNGSSDCELQDGSQAGDWRLPNIRELLSVVDFSQVFPVLTLPDGHPFTNVVAFEDGGYPASYWSSTSSGSDAGYTVSLTVGWVNRLVHRLEAVAWAVRNG